MLLFIFFNNIFNIKVDDTKSDRMLFCHNPKHLEKIFLLIDKLERGQNIKEKEFKETLSKCCTLCDVPVDIWLTIKEFLKYFPLQILIDIVMRNSCFPFMTGNLSKLIEIRDAINKLTDKNNNDNNLTTKNTKLNKNKANDDNCDSVLIDCLLFFDLELIILNLEKYKLKYQLK
ncbi:hypothetical protein H311_00889 [Anncaliia algerae PRA109]|nr:hypothetical protein H311_00889 [Anncaliia algerae PRA109]